MKQLNKLRPKYTFYNFCTIQFSSNSAFPTNLYMSKHITLTGSTYYYGKFRHNSSNQRIFIVKVDSSDKMIWNANYGQTEATFFAFEVTNDDNWIFFINQSTAKLRLFKIKADDGSIVQVYEHQNFSAAETTTLLNVSPDNSHLFFHSDHNGDSKL